MRLESGASGVAIGIHPNGDASRISSCTAACTVALTPGTYRVIVSRGGESSSRRIRIQESQRLILSPPDPGSRDAGATLALTGLIIGGVGSAITAYSLMTALPCAFGEEDGAEGAGDDSQDLPCPSATLVFVGLGGMATGLALGIPGLVMLVKNSRPRVDVQPYAQARPRTQFYLGVGSGGALPGLSFGARF